MDWPPMVYQFHREGFDLPAGGQLLATSQTYPNQAFRYGDNAWGIQFHPEFSAEVMRAYLKVQAPDLEKEGLDAKALIENVIDAPNATSLLGRFSRLVLNGLPVDH